MTVCVVYSSSSSLQGIISVKSLDLTFLTACPGLPLSVAIIKREQEGNDHYKHPANCSPLVLLLFLVGSLLILHHSPGSRRFRIGYSVCPPQMQRRPRALRRLRTISAERKSLCSETHSSRASRTVNCGHSAKMAFNRRRPPKKAADYKVGYFLSLIARRRAES